VNIVLHQIDNISVGLNQKDGYLNATKLCAAYSSKKGVTKRPESWLRSKRATEYIAYVSSVTSLSVTDLVVVKQGGVDEQGTWIHPDLGNAFSSWLSVEYEYAVASWIQEWRSDKTASESSIKSLERQFLPEMPLKQIDEYAAIMGKRFGKPYEQQLLIQTIQKFHPHLPIISPKSEEIASLVTAKALLIPKQIAKELGLLCDSKPYNPSPQKVNKLLEQLGYQTNVAGVWSATDKAIAANLVDRKPVSTGSSTQKDQMLWSADIIPILQEHTAAQQTLNV
jgi:hypothetical protein